MLTLENLLHVATYVTLNVYVCRYVYVGIHLVSGLDGERAEFCNSSMRLGKFN